MDHRQSIVRGLILCESTLRFPKTVDEGLIDVWCKMLNGISANLIAAAFESWLKTATDFPTPSEIRERTKSYLVAGIELASSERSALPTDEIPALPKPPPITVEEMRQIKAELAARRQSR